MLLVIGSGHIIAVTPRIIRMFAMLLPKILPNASCELPEKLAMRLTSNSGKDVPKETMVRPITMSVILYRLPMEEAPSTNKSAPFTRTTKPMTKRT